MTNVKAVNGIAIEAMAKVNASAFMQWSKIDFNSYVSDLMSLIDVSGAGIVLDNQGRPNVVAGSNAKVCQIEPTQFYTNQTMSFSRDTEIMMPFGLLDIHQQSNIDELDVHYYYGVPLLLSDGSCAGCVFVFNIESEALTTQQKTIMKMMSNVIESKLTIITSEYAYQQAIDFQYLISNHSSNAIFVKNTQFEIVFANDTFLDMYPEEQRDKVIGSTTFEDYKADEVEMFLANDKLAFKDGRHQCFETIAFPNGTIMTLETTKTRFEKDGQAYILGVAVDVTQQQFLIQQLEASQHELSQFADLATHDMRKPINGIYQLVDYIIEDNEASLDFTTNAQLLEIKTRCKKMSDFLGDLYEYAQIGTEQIASSTFNLRSLVASLDYLIDIPADMCVTTSDVDVTLPQLPLQMILIELISNAVEHYGDTEGKITVKADRQQHGVEISVQDLGCGMSTTMQQHAFTLFSQNRYKHREKGSGKGLAMVKKIIKKYRGKVSLLSKINSGTEVKVFWPN